MRAAAFTAVSLLATVLGAAEIDPRSHEVLDLSCVSEIGSRRVTLFGNGTVRLRERSEEHDQMKLGELEAPELEAYRRRLANEDLSEAESPRSGASGEWIEQCELRISLDPGSERSFRFTRHDSLSLTLARVVGIADELGQEAALHETRSNFPDGYAPRRGDKVLRHDGVLFEVIAFTSDNRGVELEGVDQPLVVFVLEEEFIGEFVELVSRR
jgi:hypothetical protein